MRSFSLDGLKGFQETARISFNVKLSFYDSPFFYVAMREKLTLVTEDDKLLKRATDNEIPCTRSSEI